MKNLNKMTVANRDCCPGTGFFWVEFEDGSSLQCCLVAKQAGPGYKACVNTKDTGYYDGISRDCNEWAADEDGYTEHIERYLIEQARQAGLEIV